MFLQGAQALLHNVGGQSVPVRGEIWTLQLTASLGQEVVITSSPRSGRASQLHPDGGLGVAHHDAPVLPLGLLGLWMAIDVQPGDQGGIARYSRPNSVRLIYFSAGRAVFLLKACLELAQVDQTL